MAEGGVHKYGAEALKPHKTIATFPVGTFLENIAVRSNGTLLLSSMLSGEIFYLDPQAADPQSTITKIWDFNSSRDATKPRNENSESPYGSHAHAEAIVEHPTIPDVFYTLSGVNSQAGTWAIYSLDLRKFTPSSPVQTITVAKIADVPSATWLNGATIIPLPSPQLIIAESFQGKLISCDLATGTILTWLPHELLGKITTRPPWPAVNGVQYFRGSIFATVSDRSIVLRADVDLKTGKYIEGSLETVATDFNGDDLAFDEDGNAYIATNPSQTVEKLSELGIKGLTNGHREVVVGGKDLEETAGPTAVAFGRTEIDRKSIYVTTTGGLIVAVGEGPGLARVVRVDVGIQGEHTE
ncbi:hypothetical protein G7Y89_g13162 [Cudoniella acicularis]|uniref:SMP-30/Gluconolactonase/LRE-like region domain-containing protein n=1 Tax=Cudoniella acicularis TaxID=354080 RepID=A0A8H4R926_9HELO|nr:hypothetical protein G7Y89_g13162 [Cudoniella acicularis]